MQFSLPSLWAGKVTRFPSQQIKRMKMYLRCYRKIIRCMIDKSTLGLTIVKQIQTETKFYVGI